jgi:hypothetical protein
MFSENQKIRLINIAKCKYKTGKVFIHVSCCGHSSLWPEMSRIAESSEPNFEAESEFDWEYIQTIFGISGIRQAIEALITQAIYYSPDMNEFQSANYSVEVTVK